MINELVKELVSRPYSINNFELFVGRLIQKDFFTIEFLPKKIKAYSSVNKIFIHAECQDIEDRKIGFCSIEIAKHISVEKSSLDSV